MDELELLDYHSDSCDKLNDKTKILEEKLTNVFNENKTLENNFIPNFLELKNSNESEIENQNTNELISDLQNENENETEIENKIIPEKSQLNNILTLNSQNIIQTQNTNEKQKNDKLFHELLINNLINIKDNSTFNINNLFLHSNFYKYNPRGHKILNQFNYVKELNNCGFFYLHKYTKTTYNINLLDSTMFTLYNKHMIPILAHFEDSKTHNTLYIGLFKETFVILNLVYFEIGDIPLIENDIKKNNGIRKITNRN